MPNAIPDDVATRIVREGVAPHAAAGWAARRADGRWELSAGGATEGFFDLASLTKPMTAMAAARQGLRAARLGSLLPVARGTPSEDASVELLLAHRAGLEANLPLFRPLVDGKVVEVTEALREAACARRADAVGPVPAEGFAPLYSDLGYALVGEALAGALGVLDAGDAIGRLVVEPLGLSDQLGSARALEALGSRVGFAERVIPTEVVAWRGGEVRGRVHDENAFALRGAGACGHAGMFGTVSAVLAFGVAVLESIERGKGALATDDDLDWLVRPRRGGTLRAGFDGKSDTGSTAGERAGPRTYGHLGFTGTSLWIDPDAEAVVVLLTNRVHPTRDNGAIRAARPRAHDALFAMAVGRAGLSFSRMASVPPPDVAPSRTSSKEGAKRTTAERRTAKPSRPPPAPRPPALARVEKPKEPEPPLAGRKRGANRWRFVRAYTTTFQVIASYMTLFWTAKLLGRAYRDQNIKAVHKTNAKRVYATILELQGLFIKVGQLLSIMANFLPEEFRAELEGLQDQVPPRPYSEIAPRIEEELGASVDEIFDDFHREPIASASLGQVHEARTKEGRRVAVKVQHQDIDEIVRLDLKTIRRIMTIVQWFVPVQGLDAYYHQIKDLLSQELDFKGEADNIEKIATNFAKDPRVHFPVPVRELSTSRVLTTTFVEGKKLTDLAGLDAMGIDKKELASRLVRVYCQMIFVDGIYHADPHPGNILVNADGDFVLLDFGAVAELSQPMREGIPEFLEGVIRRDTDRLIKALRKMGFLSRTSDEAVSEKIIEYFHQKFQEEVKLESFNLKDIKIDPQRGFENLLDLRKMNVGLKELSDAFHIPRDWVLLERTILLVYGCCSMLDPELNPMGIIQPYLQDFVLGNRDWQKVAMETVRDMALRAVTLPEDLRKYLQRATRGEMEVRVKGVQEGARTLYVVGRQVIYTAIGIATGYAALSLHGRGEDGTPTKVLVGVACFCGFMLLVSSIFSRPGRPR